MRFTSGVAFSLVVVLIAAPFSFADSRYAKVCGMSQRTLAKNPACSAEVKAEAALVDCTADEKGHEKMNALQAKCQAGASAAGAVTSQKLADLKAAGANDPKAIELKNKLEAAKAAKAAAESAH